MNEKLGKLEKRAKLDKKYIGHMLYFKEHGYSVLYVLRKSALRYLILIALVPTLMMLNRKGFILDGGLIFITGLIVGALARDFGWIQQSKRVWPLYEKVIDWGKVKEISDKDTSDSQAQV